MTLQLEVSYNNNTNQLINQNLNIETRSDNQWHYTCVDMYSDFFTNYPLYQRSKIALQNVCTFENIKFNNFNQYNN